MKSIVRIIGQAIFWVGWPFWYFYFKASNRRSRVLVIYEGRVLLVKGWLSTGKWSLPGGGAHKNEELAVSATRELNEEVAIQAAESALRLLGTHHHGKHGLRYTAWYYVLELNEQPEVKKRQFEISDAEWFSFDEIRGSMLDEGASFALKKYRPLNQTELL